MLKGGDDDTDDVNVIDDNIVNVDNNDANAWSLIATATTQVTMIRTATAVTSRTTTSTTTMRTAPKASTSIHRSNNWFPVYNVSLTIQKFPDRPFHCSDFSLVQPLLPGFSKVQKNFKWHLSLSYFSYSHYSLFCLKDHYQLWEDHLANGSPINVLSLFRSFYWQK
jgi:hypothetical protein